MKAGLLLSLFFTLLLPNFLSAQEYNYTHYDIADGLASSTTYCITQDKDGFIWVGTEAGVCRFDGAHFRTFTPEDGLNDIEVLQIFGDSRGRVWMAPFRGSVCYYYQGRIHNQKNDSLLAAIHLHSNIENFAEDAAGNVLIQEKTALFVVRRDGGLRTYDSAGGSPITRSVDCGLSWDGHFNVQIDQSLFELSDSGLTLKMAVPFPYEHTLYFTLSPNWMVWRTDTLRTEIKSLSNNLETSYPFYPAGFPITTHISYSILDDSLLYINQYSGATEYNMKSSTVQRSFLPGKRVSRAFRDQAGNIWFTTIGDGIYRLNSEELKTIHLPESGIGVASVHAIAINLKGDHLLVGDNHNVVFPIRLPDMKITGTNPTDHYGASRILFIHQVTEKRFIFGSDVGLAIGDIGKLQAAQGRQAMKSAMMIDSNHILIGGPWGAGIYDIRLDRLTDTLWKDRITALYNRGDTNYIGTLHGLWRIVENRPAQYMGDSTPFLRNRISALVESPTGTLWIASYDAGIIGYRNGRVLTELTQSGGLPGNICHTLFLHDGILWAGTDKGLDRIELDKPGFPISFLTANDGLASDVVNVIFALGHTIYVGTSAGLTYFDETRVKFGDECRLNLTGAISSGRNRIGDSAGLLLPAKENNVRFEFSAISYRSVGKVRYRYRLLGLDTVWRETQDNYLAYPTLPSGDYKFQVQAINRFGDMSVIRSVPIVVDTHFWNRLWFLALELAAFLALTWLFVNWRVKQIRRQQEQKAMQSRRMAELEHIALQSQMNPHFIFNCLNSIQQFVFDRDMMATNEYISGFARLIRATLNHSSKLFISVGEEVEYLSDYLYLEKMRFKNKMDYSVEVGPEVDLRGGVLPPMMLQPYVENSVRHGLRHKADGQGQIQILFRQRAEHLVVTIRDNGIGRKKAMEYKTGEHIEYQSKGMSLTSARIQMIAILYKSDIKVQVTDLADAEGRANGTQVEVSFPAMTGVG